MSGIAGIYTRGDEPVDRDDLNRMILRISHRGPDGSAVWSAGAVGFAHAMLWTTHESLAETLPLADESGECVITADARIDNRSELLSWLELDETPSPRLTDSALILHAYLKWGERCVDRLVGDFAFAIWCQPAQSIFCARDHLGVRPFYYYHSDRLFAFASEIKALLCLQDVPRRLNEQRVADYLVPLLEDKEITFFEGVFRLPPAETLTVSRERIERRRYWCLDPTREIRCRSDDEYAEAFRSIFVDAVRCRLRSDRPIGSMLSGGLDSSSIVSVARELLQQDGKARLHTFSLIFDDLPECDERRFINAILSQGGVEPHFVHGDRLSPLADLEIVNRHEDEAYYAPNLFLHWALYKAGKQASVRVLFDGLDGDTTVSHSILFIAELARTGRWLALAQEVSGISRHFNCSAWTVLWRYALAPNAPDSVRTVWRFLCHRNRPFWKTSSIANDQFARRVGLAQRVHHTLGDRAKAARTSRSDHWQRLTSGMVPFTLEVANRAAAAFQIEPRYPFYDKRLVEFCLALPAEQKIREGWTRIVLRRAMADILPRTVQWREGKSNLWPVLNRGLLTFAKSALDEVVEDRAGVISPYVDMSALRQAYRRYTLSGTDDSLQLWKAVTLATWLRQEQLLQTREIDNGF